MRSPIPNTESLLESTFKIIPNQVVMEFQNTRRVQSLLGGNSLPVTRLAIHWSERGLVPDYAMRAGIRRLLEARLQAIAAYDCAAAADLEDRFIDGMNAAPIALTPDLANDQHYEVPAVFFRHCLGKHLKYSACYWDGDTRTLDDAETNALQLSCEHADLQGARNILELGCGWGSLTLWMAERYPGSRITAVSNSNSQREFITEAARRRNLENVEVITCDINCFDPGVRFDRIVSVEMFEHLRNYATLFGRVHDWLAPGGKFFLHIFVHRTTPYAFEVMGDDDWMSRFFFSGGMMPSDDLPLRFQRQLNLKRQWRWSGVHYEKTANAWLANLDRHSAAIEPILIAAYGEQDAEMWRNRWRIFFMSCAELFGYRNGQEWWVSHYQFERRILPAG
jgi:cyclopropane-fatty-acyl-phospholipid synthase